MKLYDISKNDFKEVNVGDTFRTIQVYECETCHVKTNLWGLGRWYTVPKPYVRCPGGEYIEHFELERLLATEAQLDEKVRQYQRGLRTSIDKFRLTRVLDSIREEKEVVADLVVITRKLFEPLHNVVGDGLLSQSITLNQTYASARKSLRDPTYDKVTSGDYFRGDVDC